MWLSDSTAIWAFRQTSNPFFVFMSFDSGSVRKFSGEFGLMAIAYNLKRLATLNGEKKPDGFLRINGPKTMDIKATV